MTPELNNFLGKVPSGELEVNFLGPAGGSRTTRVQGFVFQKRNYRSVVNGTPIAGHKCSQVTLEVSILGAFFVSVAKHEQCVSCSTLSISRDDSFWVARHRQCSAQFV